MTETAPPEHVPADQTGWVRLGIVTSGHSPIAIVGADAAGALNAEWMRRRTASWETPSHAERSELLLTGTQQSEEITLRYVPGDGDIEDADSALMFHTEMPAAGIIEGRFGTVYSDGHMQLIEVRIRLWRCTCICHRDQDIDEADACDGHCCHDGSQ
jgi:hypothetical protein